MAGPYKFTFENLEAVPEALRPHAKPVGYLGGPWVVEFHSGLVDVEALQTEIATLRHRLEVTDAALTDTNDDLRDARKRVRELESRVREDEQYEHSVAKLLIAAGAPEVVHPIERVKWASRRLVETRPISDKRAALILTILDNARSYVQHGTMELPSILLSLTKDITAALSVGNVIGRDDGPFHAARRICANDEKVNLIDEWFIPPATASGSWRVRQDTLVRLIADAIEEQVAIATEVKTALLAEIAGAMTTVYETAEEDHVIRPGRDVVEIGVLVAGPGADDEDHRDDLLARIKTVLKGRTA